MGYQTSRKAIAALLVSLTMIGPDAVAQKAGAVRRLDDWVMMRIKGAELLPDSISGQANVAAAANTRSVRAPRIEGFRVNNRRDTVVALLYEEQPMRTSFPPGSTVKLADARGGLTSISANIVARRAFRAPRIPNAAVTPISAPAASKWAHTPEWRVGWAYLVALTPESVRASNDGFNGWYLVGTAATRR